MRPSLRVSAWLRISFVYTWTHAYPRSQWGNSLGLRIPKAFAEETAIRQDSVVDLSISEGSLVVRPIDRRYNLDDLLEEVTPANQHGEVDFGPSVGREEW